MKKQYISIMLLFMLVFAGCEKFIEDWDESPNSPKESTPALLLTNTQVSTFASYTGQNARTAAILIQQCTGVSDQMFNDIQNYNIGEGDVDNEWQNIYENSMQTAYTLMKDYKDDHPYYTGIARILMAMNLGLATDFWGDVPYSEALKGLEGEEHYFPHFESQEIVFQHIQTLLDEAITLLQQPKSANLKSPDMDDLIFQGDIESWVRTAWMLKARYAMRLTKKNEATAASNALSYLNSAYAAGLDSTDDDCMAHFNGTGNDLNQWWAFEQDRGYIRMNSFFVELLKDLGDPRLPYLVEEVDGDYIGADMGETRATGFSYLGDYYNRRDASLPLFTYEEAKFIEAEAQLRNNNSAAAATAYNEAVIASVQKITGSSVSAEYLEAEANETESSITLEKIMTQKYIALFTQPEVWSDWRRTNIPALEPYAEATGTTNIPRRFPLPQSERLNNPNAPSQVDIVVPVWWDE